MKKLLLLSAFIFLSVTGLNAQRLERSVESLRRDSIFSLEWDEIANLWDSLSTIEPSKNHRFGYSARGMMSASDTCFTEWDKLLNKYYNLLKSELPHDEFLVLRDSQRKWLIYREEKLQFLSLNMPGGMIYYEIYYLRRKGIVSERVGELQSIYSALPDLTKARVIEYPEVRIIGW
jgi:uncharacterized protein YecT (DUF1311 family)